MNCRSVMVNFLARLLYPLGPSGAEREGSRERRKERALPRTPRYLIAPGQLNEKCRSHAYPYMRGVALGCIFFWYRDVFFVVSRGPKSPFWHRDLLFGIETPRSSSSGINPCVDFQPVRAFWDSTSCKLEVKKSRYRKEDRKITIPQRRHLDAN